MSHKNWSFSKISFSLKMKIIASVLLLLFIMISVTGSVSTALLFDESSKKVTDLASSTFLGKFQVEKTTSSISLESLPYPSRLEPPSQKGFDVRGSMFVEDKHPSWESISWSDGSSREFKKDGIHASSAPLSINGNADFASQALSNGWPGDGTSGNPYQLTNLVISTNASDAIFIQNTDVFFIIRNSTLTAGTYSGLILKNVTNAWVEDNTVTNSSKGYIIEDGTNIKVINNTACHNLQSGFSIARASTLSLTNNTACNNQYNGIELYETSNSTFTNNHLYNNSQYGIRTYSTSYNNTFSNNNIHHNTLSGFGLLSSINDTLINNVVHDNAQYGIVLNGVFNATLIYNNAFNNTLDGFYSFVFFVSVKNLKFINNTAINNQRNGFYLDGMLYGTMVNNMALNNTKNGFYLYRTINTSLSDNSANNNQEYGIILDGNGNNNTLIHNTAANNGLSGLNVSVSVNNTFLNDNHLFERPHITFPSGNETVSGIVTIQWNNSIDSLNHVVTYRLYYSANNGTTWTLLASNLTETSYQWDTFTVNNGTQYRIKIVATDSDGLTALAISDISFTIQNVAHSLTSPTILFPNGGEILSGNITIQWNVSIDSHQHPIVYDVLLSSDGGVTWTSLASGLTTTSYQWDTTTVMNGTVYEIKVSASDGNGISTEDRSDATFSIANPTNASEKTDTTTVTTSSETQAQSPTGTNTDGNKNDENGSEPDVGIMLATGLVLVIGLASVSFMAYRKIKFKRNFAEHLQKQEESSKNPPEETISNDGD